MWKIVLALVLAGGGYYLYENLSNKGTIGAGTTALDQLENKKNKDFNKVE